MAEREAPLLGLAGDAGNNGSIRLLWRGCQAGKHSLFILAVGMAGGMQDPPHAYPEGGQGGHSRSCRTRSSQPQLEPSLPASAPGGAGGCLAPCKEGGQPALSSTHSGAQFGVTGLFPSHAHSPRLRGLSPSSLNPPVQPRQSTSPSCWLPVPQFPLTHPPAPGPDPSSNPPKHRLGVSDHSPKSGCCKEGGQAEAGWGKAERWTSGRGKGTVTWKQPDNGHRPHRENKAAGELGHRSWPGG